MVPRHLCLRRKLPRLYRGYRPMSADCSSHLSVPLKRAIASKKLLIDQTNSPVVTKTIIAARMGIIGNYPKLVHHLTNLDSGQWFRLRG